MSDIEIDGVYTQSFQIKKYRYFMTDLVLHTSVTMIIILTDVYNDEVHRIFKLIKGEEYDAWGVDDSYLETIAQQEVEKIFKKPLLKIEEDVILEDVDIIPTE